MEEKDKKTKLFREGKGYTSIKAYIKKVNLTHK